MSATTSILFVTLGSMHQIDGGTPDYQVSDSILSKLSADATDSLLKTRGEAFKWLISDKSARWQGLPISEHAYNKNLVNGQEFGGYDRTARYYPALHRFEGRFFQTLGLDGKQTMCSSRHHVLFICGLYGLSALLEPIQRYNCPVETDLKNFSIWTRDDALTNILLSYIDRHQISRVFDFTATAPRRRLIAWHIVQEKLKGDNVLHCFSTTAAGDDALISFAQLMIQSMLNVLPDQLLTIKPENEIGDVVFRKFDKPRSGMPVEIEAAEHKRELGLKLELEKKRHGVICFVNMAERVQVGTTEGLKNRVDRLQLTSKIQPEEADAMRAIIRVRNPVVYEQYQPTKDELGKVEQKWNYLKHRVQKRGWKIHEFE